MSYILPEIIRYLWSKLKFTEKARKIRENAAKTISPPNHKKNGLYTMFAAALLSLKGRGL